MVLKPQGPPHCPELPHVCPHRDPNAVRVFANKAVKLDQNPAQRAPPTLKLGHTQGPVQRAKFEIGRPDGAVVGAGDGHLIEKSTEIRSVLCVTATFDTLIKSSARTSAQTGHRAYD